MPLNGMRSSTAVAGCGYRPATTAWWAFMPAGEAGDIRGSDAFTELAAAELRGGRPLAGAKRRSQSCAYRISADHWSMKYPASVGC